ncbi:MAG: long-chain-fatty-acid--CoA ligase [Proteobacteria bacterium]|nr:long-chain-fatty-acid--CoA ligase [Pseudomonadota bacterium]
MQHTLDWVIRHAGKIYRNDEAIVDGDIRYTFGQFEERVNRLAQALLTAGVGYRDRVAVLMNNSHRYLELHFAVPCVGAIIVPVNTRLAPAEMQYIIEDSGAKLLIVDEINSRAGTALGSLVTRVIKAPEEYESLVGAAANIALPGPRSENDAAGLYYTGGTTGPSKGVVITHRNHMAHADMVASGMAYAAGKPTLYVFPLFHLGAICGIYDATWRGCKQVFVGPMDPGLLLETIEKERIHHTAMVPTLINFMINHPDLARRDLSSLKYMAHGAAPIAPDLCRRAVAALKCKFVQAYGMSEACGIVTLLHDEQDLLDTEKVRSAGRATAGAEVKICRTDGSLADTREIGEILLRSPAVMVGYWNKPKETAEVLQDDWYRSGDMGYLDEEQYLYVVDRNKDMIISGGENVYSVEVEAALATHPAVFECAVVGIPDAKWGEAVHAVVVKTPGQEASEAELIAHCRRSIAGYKCPKSVHFQVEALPKSALGKILKRDIRAPYWVGQGRNVG